MKRFLEEEKESFVLFIIEARIEAAQILGKKSEEESFR